MKLSVGLMALRAEAVARAITVINAKIKSLDKSRTKMLALRDTLSTEHQS